MNEIAFSEVDRPKDEELLRRTMPSPWRPLITAVLATATTGKAISLPAPKDENALKSFKTGLYTRMRGHNVATRCFQSADKTQLLVWAEPRKDDGKAEKKKK